MTPKSVGADFLVCLSKFTPVQSVIYVIFKFLSKNRDELLIFRSTKQGWFEYSQDKNFVLSTYNIFAIILNLNTFLHIFSKLSCVDYVDYVSFLYEMVNITFEFYI